MNLFQWLSHLSGPRQAALRTQLYVADVVFVNLKACCAFCPCRDTLHLVRSNRPFFSCCPPVQARQCRPHLGLLMDDAPTLFLPAPRCLLFGSLLGNNHGTIVQHDVILGADVARSLPPSRCVSALRADLSSRRSRWCRKRGGIEHSEGKLPEQETPVDYYCRRSEPTGMGTSELAESGFASSSRKGLEDCGTGLYP